MRLLPLLLHLLVESQVADVFLLLGRESAFVLENEVVFFLERRV